MCFPLSRFIATVSCLMTITVQSFAELDVPHHPSTDNGWTKKLTYTSEDDDAVLIWNYNSGSGSFTEKPFLRTEPVEDSLTVETKKTVTPVFESTPSELTFYKKRISISANGLLNRNVRSFEEEEEDIDLQIYEGDPVTNTISLRFVMDVIDITAIDLMVCEPSDCSLKYFHIRPKFVSNNMYKKCKLWDDSMCLENVKLCKKVSNNTMLQIRVCFSNSPCRPSIIKVLPDFEKKVSDPPSSLDWTCSGHGIMKLKWSHPNFPYTKIQRFEIIATTQETFLIKKNCTGISGMINTSYAVASEQKEYSTELRLCTSTEYRISVSAVNQRNTPGMAVNFYDFVPTSIAFADGEELQVTQNGNLIEVKTPTVVNATIYTSIVFTVKGLVTCTEDQSPTSSTSAKRTVSKMEWLAASYQLNEETPESLKIYASQTHDLASKCFLHLGETYVIEVLLDDANRYEKSNTTISAKISLTNGETVSNVHLAWLIIVPILWICLLLLFIWHRKRETLPRKLNFLDLIESSVGTTNADYSTADCNGESLTPQPRRTENRSSEYLYAIPKESDSCSVMVKDFEEYTKRGVNNGLLRSQFMLLRKGLTRPHRYGSLPENIAKNRYKNLIAYDDTRVVLEKISGDPYSDYINASYIKGYRKERAYIATQGPKSNTVKDFWRMIWQEEVRVICMLTNTVEGTKKTCEKYWPHIGAEVKYGEIYISNTDHRVFADYTFRTFELNYQQYTRKVTHLHYTGWPDIGVPTYPQSLVRYLKTLLQTPTGNGPVVVHSGTGSDRTGIIILCDICLRQADAEGMIDVTAVTTRMRVDRANMVANLPQYLLAHILITESIMSSSTQIPWTGIESGSIQKMRMRLPSDLQRLNDSMWEEKLLQSLAATNATLSELDTERIIDVNSSNEINQIHAVSVDTSKVKNQYLASWLPLALILPHFWSFVMERKIKLIILLRFTDPRDSTCSEIFLNESILPRHMKVKIKTILDEKNYFTTEKLVLTNTWKVQKNAESQSLTVFTCKGWENGQYENIPPPAVLISLWQASEKILRKEGQTLVLCDDNIIGCGLYLALSFLLEQMSVDRECDVISAVRAVRRSRPEFLQSLEQCKYLYDAAETYAESFQTYANFS